MTFHNIRGNNLAKPEQRVLSANIDLDIQYVIDYYNLLSMVKQSQLSLKPMPAAVAVTASWDFSGC